MIRFVDLFAGTGGLRLGLESAARDAGIPTRCVLSSEISTASCDTYERNFGERPQGDIREIDDIEPFDFLLAGFPCQPFSYAGKQKGFGDTRGTLFFEIERILEKYKPRAFLLENVRGLTTHDGGKTFSTIIRQLERLGYGVKHLIINSSTMGLPQNRIRVYILGILGEIPAMDLVSNLGASDSHKFKSQNHADTLFDLEPNLVVRDILESNPDTKYDCSEDFQQRLIDFTGGEIERLNGVRLIDYRGGNSIHSWDLGLRGECNSDEVELMNALIANRRLKKFGAHQDGKRLTREQIETFFPHANLSALLDSLEKKGYIKSVGGAYNPVAGNMSFEVFKFLDPDSVSITLVSSDAHRLGVVHNGRIRRITPREAARMQGYPETYQLHPDDGLAFFQLGNAVSVPVVANILSEFLRLNSDALRFPITQN